MSKELLAKVAFAAMNGDEEESQMAFEEYCEYCDNLVIGPKVANLHNVALSCVAIIAGEEVGQHVQKIANEFCVDVDVIESPNEDKTMEEERAESYNESVQQ